MKFHPFRIILYFEKNTLSINETLFRLIHNLMYNSSLFDSKSSRQHFQDFLSSVDCGFNYLLILKKVEQEKKNCHKKFPLERILG